MALLWPDFFEEIRDRYPSMLAFAISWWHYNMPLLERIRQIVSPPARILEVGTGTGAIAILLEAYGYNVVGIDSDTTVIERAKELTEYFHVSCQFRVGDGFNLAEFEGKFDLAFSSGVIEHFPQEEAILMLIEKGRAAKYVLTAVPTSFALRNDPLSDASGARPIRLKELRNLFDKAGLEVLKSFGYGIPDGAFSWIYRYLLPPAVQMVLQNRLSYACTVGCIGRSRRDNGFLQAGK
jgi:SAM-dependent methyltransferase